MNRRLLDVLFFIAPLLAAILLYWGCWGFGYVWDDRFFFQEMDSLHADKPWLALLSPLPEGLSVYYRPLPMFFFSLLVSVGGGEPYPFHVVSLLIHLANIALVMAILGRVARIPDQGISGASAEQVPVSRGLILFWGLLFAVHPVLVESVCWISSHFDMQMTFWLLLLAFCGLVLEKGVWQFLVATLTFLFAASSKEMSITFPVVYFLLLCLLYQQGRPLVMTARFVLVSRAGLWAGMVAGGILYVMARLYVMHGNVGFGYAEQGQYDAAAHFGHFARTVFWYFRMLMLPFYGLGPYNPVDSVPGFQREYLVGGVVVLLFVGLLSWKRPAIGWPFLLFFLALVPVLHLLPVGFGQNFVADRYLTYPLALLVIAAAAGTFAAARQRVVASRVVEPDLLRRYIPPVSILLILLLAFCARSMVPLWKNEMGLWSWVYGRHPQSLYAFSMLVGSYSANADCPMVEALVRQDGRSSPTIAISLSQCIVRREPEKAVQMLEAMLSSSDFVDPSQMVSALSVLAQAYAEAGNFEKSFEIFGDVLRDDGRRNKTRMHYAEALMQSCNKAEADRQYAEAASSMPPVAQGFWKEEYARWAADYAVRCAGK